jgi:hypothetical protein
MSSTIDNKSARRCPSKSYSFVSETVEVLVESLSYNLTFNIVTNLVEKLFSHGRDSYLDGLD